VRELLGRREIGLPPAGAKTNELIAKYVHTRGFSGLYMKSHIIIWLCFTRTGNYQIHEFDWLKSILKAV